MSFQGLQAKYNRLYKEEAAWKLLRAVNAPLILAFISDLFSNEREVPFGKARVALDAELDKSRQMGWETETSAGTYLNQWIRSGWLRELDDQVSQTDACDVALRFCKNLDQRESNTTASHLRIVQEAVRDFAVAISPNSSERLTLLKHRQAEIQREIDNLNAGIVVELSEIQQRERIKEIYQLASVLTGDFRRVEDDIREMDQKIRVQMIESDVNRGDIILSVLEKEHALALTDAGSAFEGFFDLLCDQNRASEFTEQLRSILSRPVAEKLNSQQQHFLGRLMRVLTKESEHVFQIRSRTEESLRGYVESGALFENRTVDKLLSKLERLAVVFKEKEIDLRTQTRLYLPVGAIKITSPDSLRLKAPDEKLDTSGVEEHINSKQPSSEMLDYLDTVQVREAAYKIRGLLQQSGPMTLASISKKYKMKSGLEELVAFLRVAKSIGATQLQDKETVIIIDKKGITLQATIPKYLLSADMFPNNIEEMLI